MNTDITPQELQEELAGPKPPVLVDVREPFELEISVLPNVVRIPMSDIANRLAELNIEDDIVIICRTGSRSGRVAAFMQGQGFKRVRNLVTGMNGWATTVDATMSKY